MRRLVPGSILLAAVAGLAGCSPGADSASAAPTGPTIQLAVAAPAATRYEMLCDVTTFQASPGQYVNRYGIDKTGPFKDVIPSPSAHCTAKIDSGAAPVTVTLTKGKAVQSMTIAAVGDAGKTTLHVW